MQKIQIPQSADVIYNAHASVHLGYFLPRIVDQKEFLDIIHQIEEKTNLNIMAYQDKVPEKLQGFLSMVRKGGETIFFLSLYQKEKDSDEESIHKFEVTPLTPELEKRIDEAFYGIN